MVTRITKQSPTGGAKLKRPDGSTGTTSGMKLRTAVGKPGFSLPTAD